MRFKKEITRSNKQGEVEAVWVARWRPIGWPRPIVTEGKSIEEAGENAIRVLRERAA